MNSKIMYYQVVLLILLSIIPITAQENQGDLTGQVKDQFDDVIVGAKVLLIDNSNETQQTITDSRGIYIFKNLTIGSYTLRLNATGFGLYEKNNIEISDRITSKVDIRLEVKEAIENIDIESKSNDLNTEPDNNKDSTTLSGNDLEALPDDPEALETALKLLAGSSGGPDGGAIYVDGFITRNVPPKSSISEIRINRNPFSAEFDRLGYGRIEIITKTGTSKFGGSTFFKFNDESLNARNPFATTRPPFQVKRYGGDLSGSFLNKKASFYLDIDNRSIDDSVIVNATILNDQLQIVPINKNFLSPENALFLSGKTDFQLGSSNTLSFRFGLTKKSSENVGVGDFSLISRGYDSSDTTQTYQLIQTSVINEKIINQFRFQFERYSTENNQDQLIPAIIVSEAFNSGSSQNGTSKYTEDSFEASDSITLTSNNHTIRFGGRFDFSKITDITPYNFLGTYIYTGGLAPRLLNGQIILDDNGQPILDNITSIETYQRTLQLGLQGFTPSEIRQRGGGADQFSINGGNPQASISQSSLSGFIQDDWKITSNFNLGLGLRVESQSNIGLNLDVAPRIAFAWVPNAKEKNKWTTVVRGGVGLFYSRFNRGLVLQAERFDGNNIQQFIISDEEVLDSFENIPTVQDLAGLGQPLSIKKISPNIRTPYILQTALSLEQKLPFKSNLTLTYSNIRVWNAFRSRNINAPLSANSNRPNIALGDIYQYESNGRFESNRLSVIFSKLIGKNSFGVRYNLNYAKSDTDGPNSFPANQYDLSNEFGRSNLDTRHVLSMSGYFRLPFNMRLTPLVVIASGKPFNITLGQDLNGDSLFTERPSFATASSTNVIATRYGTFDLDNNINALAIPRNYGTGKAYFSASTGISKNFKFDLYKSNNKSGTETKKKTSGERFTLGLSSRIWNVFNRTNNDTPIGNLTSPNFGEAIRTPGTYGSGDPLSGSRVVEFQVRLSF